MPETIEAKAPAGAGLWRLLFLIAMAVPATITVAFLTLLVVMRPFWIPSGSMEPTLRVGDYAWAWRQENYRPHRGDIIVFRGVRNPDAYYISRLIGLPGDRVQMRQGRVVLNGKLLPQERIEPFRETDYEGQVHEVTQYKETLPDGVTYHTLDRAETLLDNTAPLEVPEGAVLILGDNRDNSSDSRDPNGDHGFVPLHHVEGRMALVLFSTADLWRLLVVPQ